MRRPALPRCEPIEPVNPILLTASAEQRASSPTGERTRRRQPVRRIAISSRVFVGNLSYETSREELETAFSRVGQVVDVVLPVDRATDRPRGFAFVEFSDSDLVSKAIQELDGVELGGRTLRVSEARERVPRPSFGGGGWDEGGGPGGGGPDTRPGWGPDRPPKSSRPKGSRRGVRGRKRGF